MEFNINDKSTEGLGLYFKRGSLYSELLRLPKPKQRFFNEWADEHGRDYDESAETVYDPLEYDIACYLVAEDVYDLQEKRSAILSMISAPGGFTMFSNTLGRGFHLRYMDSPSFRNLTPLFVQGKLYCEFTLKLENNFQETDTQFFLADDEAFILTEDNEYIIVTEKQQNF